MSLEQQISKGIMEAMAGDHAPGALRNAKIIEATSQAFETPELPDAPTC